MLEKIGNYLQGKKTYIIVFLGVILNGLQSQGYITVANIELVNTILTFLGLGTIRSGVNKAKG